MQAAAATPAVLPPARVPQPVASVGVPPSSVASAQAAVQEAMRATGTESPASAGADFARPSVATPAPRSVPALAQVAPPPRQVSPTTAGGPWKLQLGAFSIAGSADRLWSQLAGKPALAGKAKQTVAAGKLTRLLAAGWPSEGAAQAACNTLKAGGQTCIVTR
jgi:cell division protein FtsN